jgi:hypothetical protein
LTEVNIKRPIKIIGKKENNLKILSRASRRRQYWRLIRPSQPLGALVAAETSKIVD